MSTRWRLSCISINTPYLQGYSREQMEENSSDVGQLQQKHLEKIQHLEAQLAAKDQEALVNVWE